MLRRPKFVPVARVGRSVPEGRCCGVPSARVMLGAAAGLTMGWASLSDAAPPVPIPKIGVPQPCAGGLCGTTNRPFVAGQGNLLNGATTAVNAPVWNPANNTLTVTQNADKVVLNWSGFNIAAGNTVVFAQPGKASVAMNKIWDANPSQIFGRLQANGSVYLINQNGIVFGQGAQVSVGGLLASTLNLKNSDFLNSILAPGQLGNPLLTAVDDAGVRFAPGAIEVQAGANISTPTGAAGQIVLAGGTVNNAGNLRSPDGQTLLLAGDSVWVARSDALNNTVHGFVVAVDDTAGSSTTGVVNNSGSVSADRGNVTLAGLTVNQQGVVHATTSVSFNGSIFLTAGNYGGAGPALNGGKFLDILPSQQAGQVSLGGVPPTRGGNLTLAAGSSTEVRPDLADTTTAVDAQAQQPSTINLQALNIAVGANASLAAPGGAINLVARTDLSASRSATPAIDTNGVASATAGSIVVDGGAVIDVSGTRDVLVPVTREFVQAQLRGNELADSPLQRNGFLYTQNVTVDVRGVDTNGNIPLANIAGYVGAIDRTVAERTSTAGTVTLDAGSTVALRQGSTINLSGGSLDYQGGFAASTKLLASNGKVYDIMNAPANLSYTGFADRFSLVSSQWGTRQSWLGLQAANRTFVPGYAEGRNAGTLAIFATQTALDGSVVAQTTRGPNQRVTTASVSAAELANTLDLGARQYREAPLGGTLSIGDPADLRAQTAVLTHTVTALDAALSDSSLVTSGLPDGRSTITYVPMDALLAGGISAFNIYAQDSATLAAGSPYQLPAGGSLNLNANTVQLNAGVTAHGGSIRVQAQDPFLPVGPPLAPYPTLSVASGVTLDVSGEWVNDSSRQLNADLTTLKNVYGGTISLRATGIASGPVAGFGGVTLGQGSVLDVSGGAYLDRTSALYGGPAGSITVTAPGLGVADARLGLSNGASFRGYGFAGGGKLSLTAPQIRLGQGSTVSGENLFTADLFQQGGFASVTLNAQANLTVDPGTTIAARADNRLAVATAALLPTGTALDTVATITTLPDTQRANPMTVSLNSLVGGVVSVGTGASVTTDARGSISLQSTGGRVYIDGTLAAPSGNLSVGVKGFNLTATYDATQSIWLGSHAQLLAAESTAVQTTATGRRIGGLINDGGNSVTLNAQRGSVISEAGSLIDVSGAQATVDLAQSRSGAPVATTLDGSAGTVSVSAADFLQLAGRVNARTGGVQGTGGTLKVALTNALGYDLANTPNLPGSGTETLTVSGAALPTLPAGLTQGQGLPASRFGTGVFSVQTLAGSGIDALSLSSLNTLQFGDSASVTLGRSLSLSAPQIGGMAGAVTALQAPYLSLFGPGNAGAVPLSSAATGASLTAQAGLIDVTGSLLVTGYDSTRLQSSGDIRLIGLSQVANGQQGALQVQNALTLDARQVYPVTVSQFSVTDSDSIHIVNSQGRSDAPLSAGGSLRLSAPVITQDGVLRAPFGTLDLNAGNSLSLGSQSITSVSGNGLDVPFGNTANGQSAYYSLGTAANAPFISLSGAPAKRINLTASTAVTVNSGATVDLSGGGDLLAYESVIGPGGSRDILNNNNTYAILPGTPYAQGYAPYDPLYAGSGASVGVGSQVYLSGGPFAAGYYTLLPSHYALLQGGYAVKLLSTPNPVSGQPLLQGNGLALVRPSNIQSTLDATPGVTVKQADGSYLVAGKLGLTGTPVLAPRWSTWQVLPSDVIHQYSQLDVSQASSFFPAAALKSNSSVGVLPGDAGALLLAAGTSLNLPDNINTPVSVARPVTTTFNFAGSAGARGGELDLSARDLAVVADTNASNQLAAGTLAVNASTLDALQAERLVLGGSVDANTGVLTVGANTVTIANDAASALIAPDLLIAASGSVTVSGGSVLSTRSGSGVAPLGLSVSGDSAILRLTDGTLPSLQRTPFAGAQAVLKVAAAADPAHQTTLSAAGSVTLDSAATVTLDPATVLLTPALRVDASSINLGAVQDVKTGASLTQATLAQARTLVLQATQDVRLFGNTAIGSLANPLGSLTLDAPSILAADGGNTVITARNITLQNSNAAPVAPVTGTGTLSLHAVQAADGSAGDLLLGTGQQALSGFAGIALAADHAVTIQGAPTRPIALGASASQSAAATAPTSPVAASGLASGGAITLISPLVQAASNSNYALASDQALTLTGTGTTSSPPPAVAAGGRLTLQGSSVNIDTAVVAPGGAITAEARTGDVNLGGKAAIVASGYTRTFQGATSVADAGSVTLTAGHGTVRLAADSQVRVDAASGGGAGSIALAAPEGTVLIGGTLSGKAAAGQTAGSLSVDAGGLDAATLGSLAATAASGQGDFTELVDLRVRQGDLTLPAGTNPVGFSAHTLRIAADQGSLTVQGALSADADIHHADAGSIALWAGRSLTLDGALSASSATGAAGRVTLGLGSGSAGQITATPGASIALQGTTPAPGVLTLIAPQTADGMALGTFAATGLVSTSGTAPQVNLEAVQHYDGIALDAALLGAGGLVDSAAATLAGQRSSILAALPAGAATALFTGVEVDHPLARADGMLISAGTSVDLSGLHFVGSGVNPGELSIRAPGSITIGGTLTDGFVRVAGTGRNAVSTVQAQAADAGGQWSYQLVAGADLTAANPLTVANTTGAGSLKLLNTALIRTGSGGIRLAAAGDVRFSAQTQGQSASVYTAGLLTPFPSTFALPFQPNGATGSTAVFVQRTAGSATQVQYIEQFTSGGGDVSVTAGGNVLGSGSVQQVNDWLYRSATVSPVTGLFANPLGGRGSPNQTAWWVEFDQFHMDLGALGGGNIVVQAKGAVNDLTAAVPTNGRQGGGLTASTALISPANLFVEGGGNLAVRAGGDILGGSYYVERGQGQLHAGGGILANPAGAYAPVLAMGDSQFSLVAGNSIDLLTAYNPFTVPQVLPNVTGGQVSNGVVSYPTVNDGQAFTTYFTTYDTYNAATTQFSTQASLRLLSQGGDVSLGKGLTAFGTAYQNKDIVTSANATGGFRVLPATVGLTAQQGSINVDQAFLLAPAPDGNLTVLAGGSVDLRQIAPGNQSQFRLSSASADLLANPSRQVTNTLGNENAAGVLDGFSQVAPNALHQGDTEPVRIVADHGSIAGTADGTSSLLSVPKPVVLSAGQDISGLSVVAQNLATTDVSSLSAGRDIVLSPRGQVPNGQTDGTGIEVDGPGRLLLQAGRNIDLGSAQGVISRSNNTVASTVGASISAYAGLGACDGGACAPALDAFAKAYIDPATSVSVNHGNAALLQAYVNGLKGDGVTLSTAEAWAAFQMLTPGQQSLLAEQVLSNELHLNALDHNVSGASFAAGYQAIGTLFPGSVVDTPTGTAVNITNAPTLVAKATGAGTTLALQGSSSLSGNVSMVYSQLRTLSGGDIGVFTPNGGLDVGLANQPPGTPKKTPDQLGLVTQASGTVRAVAANNINVNASRIFSVGGGDIALWSSFGNIDAGKGAKSVQVVPPPTFSFNAAGQLVITVTGATSGSGIGALLTGPGQTPGNVDLIAPVGIVDAGDAGIRAAGNLNIAAAVVLNAANVQVGGTSTGVPAVESVSVAAPAPTTSANNNAGQSSDETGKRLAEDAKRADDLKSSFKPTIVTVEVSAEEEGPLGSERCNGPDCKDKVLVR